MKMRLKIDKKNRLNFKCSELLKVVYKSIYNNRMLSIYIRMKTYNKLRLKIKISICRIRNYCLISGRSGGVFSEFKLSRIVMRELFSNGKFYGISKSSW